MKNDTTQQHTTWFVHKIPHAVNAGYRYCVTRDSDGHGWWIAAVCNGDDAEEVSSLIAAAPSLAAEITALKAQNAELIKAVNLSWLSLEYPADVEQAKSLLLTALQNFNKK
jgi:hypothetical protein